MDHQVDIPLTEAKIAIIIMPCLLKITHKVIMSLAILPPKAVFFVPEGNGITLLKNLLVSLCGLLYAEAKPRFWTFRQRACEK